MSKCDTSREPSLRDRKDSRGDGLVADRTFFSGILAISGCSWSMTISNSNTPSTTRCSAWKV